MTRQASQDPVGTEQDRQREEQSPMVDHWLAIVESQFGERLDDAGRARVREQLGRIAEGAAKLSARGLANAEEPDFVFGPYRGA